MASFKEIWKEYLKEPAKELARSASESALSFIFEKIASWFKNLKKKKEFKEEKVEVIHVPVKEPVKVTWVKGVPHFSSRKGADISAIVVHHTGKGGLKATLSWAKHKDSKISYHYVIDKDGEIYQLVKEGDKAWHAGKSQYKGKSNWNVFSVGVALVNDGDGKDEYTEEQYKALAFVCKMLQKKYDITNDWIVGHNTIAPERKHDPAHFDWNKFFDMLNAKKL